MYCSGCTGLQTCAGCEEEQETPVSIKVENGKLWFSALSENVMLMMAVYENGQMKTCGLQQMNNEQMEIPTGAEVRIFSLNSRTSQPMREPMVLVNGQLQ